MFASRRGIALALVLAALILAGALAAGAVMAATQSMRDAAGRLARLRALAAGEQGLTRAMNPPTWDTLWTAPGPPGLVAVFAHTSGFELDTTRVIRLTPLTYLLISDSRTLSPLTLSAHARLALFVVVDSAGHPSRPSAHSWTQLP